VRWDVKEKKIEPKRNLVFSSAKKERKKGERRLQVIYKEKTLSWAT
jgi:hypothetical protein